MVVKKAAFFLFVPFLLFAEAFNFLDEDRILSWGFNPQSLQIGHIGEGEISPIVRISAINGMLNSLENCRDTMGKISTLHGETNVHYVFWNSEGWTEDLYKALCSKLGFTSLPAFELAKLWKRLIEEMGGVESEGIIIHYAHSIGATETTLAASFMTEEELRKIYVVTLGPATIIHPNGFGSVINYVSRRDAIGLLDPWHFAKAIRGDYEHVSFVGDFQWVAEHTILGDGVYHEVIENCGRQFLENFLYLRDEN